MFGTITLYTIIFSTLSIRRRPESIASTSSLAPLSSQLPASDPRTINRAARYMIIYPTIYVSCPLPLAAGRIATMTGHVIPYWYYCIAGAAITSCGWLDVLLYAFALRILVFSDAPPPTDECGNEAFGIFHKIEEFWSVTTVVEGGGLVTRPSALVDESITRISTGMEAASMIFQAKMELWMTNSTLLGLELSPRRKPSLSRQSQGPSLCAKVPTKFLARPGGPQVNPTTLHPTRAPQIPQ